MFQQNHGFFRSNLKERLEEISKGKGATIGEELVKFIPNFCDALFEILDHYPDYDSLVFDALVGDLSLVSLPALIRVLGSLI